MSWKQLNRVSERLQLTSPVVRGTARLHDHDGGRQLLEKRQEAGPCEPARSRDLSWCVGDRDLKDGLCEVDGDDGTILHGLLLEHG